jgi:hypothetical protein
LPFSTSGSGGALLIDAFAIPKSRILVTPS